MLRPIVLLTIFSLLFFACAQDAQKETVQEQQPVLGEDLDATTMEEIFALETRLSKDDPDIIDDVEAANQLITMMLEISCARRGNVELPGIIRRAAEASMFLRQYNDAVTLFTNLYQNYPDHTLAPFALFYMGFIHDEYLGDKEIAMKYYDTFLEKFPQHEFTKSVKELKLYIEKTPLEVYEILKSRGQEYIPDEEQ